MSRDGTARTSNRAAVRRVRPMAGRSGAASGSRGFPESGDLRVPLVGDHQFAVSAVDLDGGAFLDVAA
ncbi:hypothetical protein GCM10009578_095680 [Streptomyces rhizosphaericus]